MRPSLVVSLLLLSFLLQEAQGIRLEKGFMQVRAQKVQGDKSSLKERSANGGVLGEAILCKEEHCIGMGRKLIAVTTSTSSTTITTSKNEKNEGNKAGSISKRRSSKEEIVGEREKLLVNSWRNSDHKVNEDHYEEIMDLTQMDYSPARRKSPIHN
ncbi:hypothetical protein POPTR_018G115601v4 [Populus trichocarpa]|uniref:Uncharacterized protein n=1 Tax=Populus trichocarpa TaxID=3694 RepID=A0ACC0RMS9_POPTR|nr:uncharacterized protein LOC112324936 [Populus trichocarpa]KAI5557373.1 hypothetical protein BDE02_18G099300 [Populus trichocarpa]KAI9378588.1 hypothetical protein POPTR_018G115601v4 [Populus trichocarpa]|eukprot:XP_024445401.1 uncharacterized protein LOC112324936 [Populus trichocarpa]